MEIYQIEHIEQQHNIRQEEVEADPEVATRGTGAGKRTRIAGNQHTEDGEVEEVATEDIADTEAWFVNQDCCRDTCKHLGK